MATTARSSDWRNRKAREFAELARMIEHYRRLYRDRSNVVPLLPRRGGLGVRGGTVRLPRG